jgi:hypothetical protein
MIHPEDLYFLHHVDRLPIRGLCIEHHCSNSCVILNNNNSIDLFHRTDRGLITLDQQILPLELGASTLRTNVGLVESPTIREIFLLRRKELLDQQDKRQWEIWARPIGFMQQ